MVSGLTIIEFYDLAAGHFLLSLNAPPPPDVPPANIQLMARTRNGSGLFYALRKNHFPTNNHMGYLIRVIQAAV
jgi:hypothetical protein